MANVAVSLRRRHGAPQRARPAPTRRPRRVPMRSTLRRCFLSTMFSHMFTSTDGEGPFGGRGAGGGLALLPK